jgi:uncharacterized Zn ribbon protein
MKNVKYLDSIFTFCFKKDESMQLSVLSNVFSTETDWKNTMTVKLYPNEVVLQAGDTNQVVNDLKVEGKLIVTNQRIYFKSLSQESDRFNLEILFENILEVIFFGGGLFSTKGLNVVTRDGRTFSFPLKKRDEIGQLINKMY